MTNTNNILTITELTSNGESYGLSYDLTDGLWSIAVSTLEESIVLDDHNVKVYFKNFFHPTYDEVVLFNQAFPSIYFPVLRAMTYAFINEILNEAQEQEEDEQQEI